VTAAETSLLLTEPVFNLPNVQESYDQIVFEEYGFASYARQSCAPISRLVPRRLLTPAS
jgi:actin-related protein 6